jgi:outer membrane protein assembly factor BamA
MFDLCTLSLGLFTLLGMPAQAHNQSYTPQEIHFAGVSGYSDDELADAAGLKTGQSYTADELTQFAQQLLDIGIFEKVAYKIDAGKLVYTVKQSTQAYPIELSNLPIEPGAALEAKIHDHVPLYHGTVPPQGLLLEAVRQTLEDFLAGEGVHAQVGSELVTDAATHATTAVRFSIVSQPVKIGNLKLEGVSDFLKPQLDQLKALAEQPFDTEHTAAQIEQTLRDAYAGHGFAAAEVHAIRYGYPTVADGAIRVPYKVTVKEGPAFRLGTVALAQGLPLDPVEVDRLMGSRSTFMPESKFLESLIAQLEVDLKGQGYLNCHISLEPHLDKTAGVANYVVGADLGSTPTPTLVKTAGVNGALQNLIRR